MAAGFRRKLAALATTAPALTALVGAAAPPGPTGDPAPAAISESVLRDAAAAERAAGHAVLYRDVWGVPHVHAAREEDGWFALGWAQAEDQLEPLLRLVRSFRGERAAVEGPKAVDWDVFQRAWRHREEAAAGWSRLDPQVQADYRSFVAGVERFMVEHPERVPKDAIALEPVDLVLLPRALFFLAYDTVEGLADCVRGGVTLDPTLAPPGARSGADALTGAGGAVGGAAIEAIVDPAAATADPLFPDRGLLTASNGWAVAPRRTADRATVVLSDPHVEIGLPIYWEYRIHAGDLHSSGFMMGALPWQAHTRDVSWSMTTGSPDVADCFELETDPANPRRYRYDGEWRDMEVTTTTIEVAGAPPVVRELEYTRHGGVLSPVVARRGDRAWVVSVAAMHDAGLLDQEIFRMNRARDVGGVRDALETLGMFPQTLIVGDRAGGLLYLRAGKSPRRPDGAAPTTFDWSKPVPGSTSASAWKGFHALADYVQIADPPAGFLFDNNNAPEVALAAAGIAAPEVATSNVAAPAGAAPGAATSPQPYPAYLLHDQPGRITWRGQRARAVLGADGALTWNEAVALALDETWPATRRWQDAIKHTFATFPQAMTADPLLGEFFARLIRFDGRARAGSVDALTFHYFRQGLWHDFEQAGLAPSDGPEWADGELDARLAQVVLDHARRARDAWVAGGGDGATLGSLFRIGRGAAGSGVARGAEGGSGGRDAASDAGDHGIGGVTIDEPAIPDCRARLSPFCDVTERALVAGPPDAAGRRRVVRGSQALRLVQFTDPIRSWTLHPWGQSQVPGSPHYDDQSALAAQPRLKPTWFERDELMRHLESVTVLDTTTPRAAGDRGAKGSAGAIGDHGASSAARAPAETPR